MAITYQQVYEVAQQPGFKSRVKALMSKAAIAIMAESTSTAGHATKVVYSSKVLTGQASVEEFAVGVLTNSTLMAEASASTAVTNNDISDSDLEFAVNSVFGAFAGYESGGA